VSVGATPIRALLIEDNPGDARLIREMLRDADAAAPPNGVGVTRRARRMLRARRGLAMQKADVWAVIHAERKALADDLRSLSAAQWATPSLCGGWTVRDALAHMTATARMTPPRFFGKMLMSGFSFEKVQSAGIAENKGASPAETLARFTAEVGSSMHPPGPNDSWLGETLVHAEDVRRPLGIPHAYPTDAAVQVANFYKGSNLLIGAKSRIAGMRLVATDTDWQHGDGLQVSGPIMSLVMVMTGRAAALDGLTGDGVTTLAGRCR
jgi:uncharacterized protein (TIGR03083 family)